MHLKSKSQILNLINFLVLFVFFFPHEKVFNFLYPRLNTVFSWMPSENVNAEPLFLKIFADLQYKLFVTQKYISFFVIIFVFLIFQVSNIYNKNRTYNFSVRHFLVTNFFYFVFLEILIYTSRFYCVFGADSPTSVNCEEVDLLLYFGTLLPLYQVLTKSKIYFLYSDDRINKVIYITYILFFLINIGITEFETYYPNVKVSYQNLLNPNAILYSILILLLMKYILNFKPDLTILISIVLVLLNFLSNWPLKFSLTLVLIVIYFTKHKNKYQLFKIFELILVLTLLINVGLKHIFLPLNINQKTVLNEFSSTLNGGFFIKDYFNNYNNLIPYLFKFFRLEELNLFLNFKLLMFALNFLILIIMSYLIYKLFPKYSLISIFSLIGTGIFYESENFNYFSSGTFQYYQTFPLRYLGIVLAIFLYYLYKRNIINYYFLILFNVINILDNLFIGISISFAFLLVEFIQNPNIFSNQKPNLFVKKNKFLILAISIVFVYIFTFKSRLFVYFSEEYTSLLALPVAPLGTHKFIIYSTIIILIIFSHLIQTLNKKNLTTESLIMLSSFSVLILYFYFIGRSHPFTLNSVLLIYAFMIVLALNYFLDNLNDNLILLVFPLILCVNGFLNAIENNNINFYEENIFEYNPKVIDKEFLIYDSYENILFDEVIVSTIQDSKITFLLHYGSIIAVENKLNGHSPFMKYNLTNNQCNLLRDYVTNEKFKYLVVPTFQDRFYNGSWYYSDCFKELIIDFNEHIYRDKIMLNDDIILLGR